MTKSLWQHQDDSLNQARSLYTKGFRSILIQGVTGTGKTRMVASAINNAISRHRPGQDHISESKRKYQVVWFVVPRKELLWQSNQELNEWGINNQIVAGSQQRRGFNVYVWSRETLIRRLKTDSFHECPDVLIFDEAHVAIDQQIEIKTILLEISARFGIELLIFGLTATPERPDGKPLLGMYDVMVEGPQMQWFVENKYLKRPFVLSIPPKDRIANGIDLKMNAMGDPTRASIKHIDELYKARARGKKIIFGNEIDHYLEHAKDQSFLVFVRSLEQAENVAREFRDAHIKTLRIDGRMKDNERKKIIDSFKARETLGLTSVDLLKYGFDAPGASCMIDMAECWSRPAQFQKLGRVMRWDDRNPIASIHDHVGNFAALEDGGRFGHPLLPHRWNFEGREKEEKPPDDAICRVDAVQKCSICCGKMIKIDGVLRCEFCGAEKQQRTIHVKQIDGYLVEIKEPTPLKEREPESQRYYQDMLNVNRDKFRYSWFEKKWEDGTGRKRVGGILDEEAVKNYVLAGRDLKWKDLPMQVYYKLVGDAQDYVHTSLLKCIGKTLGYKPYWAIRKRQELEKKLENKRLNDQSVDTYADQYFN